MIKQFSKNGPVGVLKPCCTMAGDHTRALTARHQIKPTSPSCLSAWQPNLGRRSTYRSGKSVQTTGTTSTQPFYVAEPCSKRKRILEAMNKTYGGEFRLTLGHPAQVASMTRGQRNLPTILSSAPRASQIGSTVPTSSALQPKRLIYNLPISTRMSRMTSTSPRPPEGP